MNKKMINGMTVSRWACVNFSRSVQENVARAFCYELGQMCEVSGMVNIFVFFFLTAFFIISFELIVFLIIKFFFVCYYRSLIRNP